MYINIIYDQNVSQLPSNFVACVNAACQFFDIIFTAPVVLNIDLGYGEIDGSSLGSNDLGESKANYGFSATYAQLKSALTSQGSPGAGTLPATSPTSDTLYIQQSLEKALGLYNGNSLSLDGSVGISNAISFNMNPNQTTIPGEYDLLGVLEHEISEVMGRTSLLNGIGTYAPMDLFRFQAVGIRQFFSYGQGYFSINNGFTDLGNWNNYLTGDSGDLGDWAPGTSTDAFTENADPDSVNFVTATDILLMQALGWSSASISATQSSVAQILSDYSANKITSREFVNDSMANVVANLTGLESVAASNDLGLITLTDATVPIVPTVSITAAQLSAGQKVFGQIAGQYSLIITNVAASNLSTDLTLAHVASVGVVDSASDVSYYLSYWENLAVAGKISSISLTDSTTPTLSLTATEVLSESVVLALLTGPYTISVSGVTLANAAFVAAIPHVEAFYIDDTTANILANLSTLETLTKNGNLTGIATSDSYDPTLTVTATQFSADIDALVLISTTDYYGNVTIQFTGGGTVTANPTFDTYNLANGNTIFNAVPMTSGTLTLTGGTGIDDIVIAGADLDSGTIDGGSGTATVTFSGASTQYKIVVNSNHTISVSDTQSGRDGFVTLVDISDLQFTDQTIAETSDFPIADYLSAENGTGRGANGIAMDVSGIALAGENSVVGWQSATFTHGYDSVLLNGTRSGYEVEVSPTGATTIYNYGTFASISVTGESYLIFDGASAGAHATNGAPLYDQIYFVLNPTDAQVAEIYAAALGREPDLAGLEYWENQVASGMTLDTLAYQFVNSTEFAILFPAAAAPADHGGPNDSAFVSQVYESVLERAPDSAGADYWLAQLASGAVTRWEMLADFAVSTENMLNIEAFSSESGWLINAAGSGGYADYGDQSTLTVLTNAETSHLINTGLMEYGTTTTLGRVTVTSKFYFSNTISDGNAGDVVILSYDFNVISVDATGETIVAPTYSYAQISDNAGSTNIRLSGLGNAVSYANGDTITGYLPGSDSLSTSTLSPVLFAPTASAKLIGTTLNFDQSNYVYVGNVGDGTASDVASAANAVYKVADSNFESIVFYGQSGANTVFFTWANELTKGSADINNDQLVDANALSRGMTLVGVTATALTASDFSADAAPLPAQTVLWQGLESGNINLGLIDPNSLSTTATVSDANGNAELIASQWGGPTNCLATINNDTPGTIITIAGNFNDIQIETSNNIINDNTYKSNLTLFIWFNLTDNTINLTSTGDTAMSLWESTNTTINNFVPGGGNTLVVYQAATSAGYPAQLLDGTTTPINGSTLNFNDDKPAIINIGNIGAGTAALVAAAANKAYLVSDFNGSGSSSIGENVTFIGQDSSGNTEVWTFINYSNSALSADLNGNHLVDANEITHAATLVGLLPAKLTAADFS